MLADDLSHTVRPADPETEYAVQGHLRPAARVKARHLRYRPVPFRCQLLLKHRESLNEFADRPPCTWSVYGATLRQPRKAPRQSSVGHDCPIRHPAYGQ